MGGLKMVANNQYLAEKNRRKAIVLKQLDKIEATEDELLDLAVREVNAIIELGGKIDLLDTESVANFKRLKDSAAATVNLMGKLSVYVGVKRGTITVNQNRNDEPTAEMKMAESIVAKARARISSDHTKH
jgi:hypothetical protein